MVVVVLVVEVQIGVVLRLDEVVGLVVFGVSEAVPLVE